MQLETIWFRQQLLQVEYDGNNYISQIERPISTQKSPTSDNSINCTYSLDDHVVTFFKLFL